MKKSNKIVAFALAGALSFQSAVPVFAMESNDEFDKMNYSVEQQLCVEKEQELQSLIQEFDMSDEDSEYIMNLYYQNKCSYQTRGKIGAISKIVKVAKPIIVKGAKMFGMKMAEKNLADFTDFLFGWQDDLEDGIKTFLVEKWGWNTTAAKWVAKTIMFVAF